VNLKKWIIIVASAGTSAITQKRPQRNGLKKCREAPLWREKRNDVLVELVWAFQMRNVAGIGNLNQRRILDGFMSLFRERLVLAE
jgi:hypothetical protein